jgi:replicative superfamily II helicase
MVSVTDAIDARFLKLFPYEHFNRMQSEVLPSLLQSDDHIVVAAPTASGKTVLAELAMVRELMKPKQMRGKILYLAPLRALTNEKEAEWQSLFHPFGFKVYVVSGERELEPPKVKSADIIISTPEKWDSASRKHSTTHPFVRTVSVIVIDEVHLLDSDERGGVLEALITRMKRITNGDVRIIALSATMPNVDEVAAWIGAKREFTYLFDESYRPVPLEAKVRWYSPGTNKFMDKYVRLYRAIDLIEPHLARGQALIFVATRSDTAQAAVKAVEVFREKRKDLSTPESLDLSDQIRNKLLSEVARSGVGFHHAGLHKEDRDLIEGGFRAGHIKVLVSTSTLAWGVNLPARVVVIRDISNDAVGEDLSSLDILQMLGRAGRPQYDDRGFGWIIAPRDRASYYLELLKVGKLIQSQLDKSLDEHLNAEISMGTVQSRDDAFTWLGDTFYSVQHRDAGTVLEESLHLLIDNGFVMESDGGLRPTELGNLASRYYLRLSSALRFKELRKAPSDEELLMAVSSTEEFSDVVLRRNEASAVKRALTGLKGAKSKVLAILLAYMEKGEVPEELRSDAWIIKQNAMRLFSALEAFLLTFNAPESVQRAKVLALRLEYGAPEDLCPLLQLEGIGIKVASALFARGVRTPFDITAEHISKLISGEKVARAIVKIPLITVALDLPELIGFGESKMCYATVSNSGGWGNVCVTVSANGLPMFRDTFYLSKHSSKSVPIGVFGSKNEQVDYEVRIDHLSCVANPVTARRTVSIAGLPSDFKPRTTVVSEPAIEASDPCEGADGSIPGLVESAFREVAIKQVKRSVDEVASGEVFRKKRLTVARERTGNETVPSTSSRASVGMCKKCGGELRHHGTVITCDCGIEYKLSDGAKLIDETCSCGLPKFKLKLYDIGVCIDRKCENMDAIIAQKFASSGYVCPNCGSPLTVVRRRGIIVGCSRYYDGCKTAFLLPINAKIESACTCGLPKLRLKTKVRCLNTKCRA